jgi:putative tryptophan/tyrosine transport system substrate-binding protein
LRLKFGERRTSDLRSKTFKGNAEAIYVIGDILVNASLTRIVTLSNAARLPSLFNVGEFVRAGGLISYGPNFGDMFERAAEHVDKILPGAKPGELPIEQPTKFDLVINLTTAQVLGLTVPHALLVTADEVIE